MKLHKLSEAAKFLIIAGTILIVCTLVVVGFFVMKEGKEGTNNSMDQFNQVTSEYSDVNRESYDGVSIKGSRLLTLIKQETDTNNTDKVTINYSTKLNTTLVAAAESTLTLARTDAKYINENGTFKGEVKKDKNGVIVSIDFVQTK